MGHTIVTGVIGADCHSVGNKVIEAHFTEAGFNVINLGVMVSQDEYIEAALENRAKAILVSSLYGHGEIDCEGFRSLCEKRGLSPVVLYVGGNLVVGKSDFSAIETKFKAMGYDRVFPASVDLNVAVDLLKQDIQSL